jgi:hypothetical protein
MLLVSSDPLMLPIILTKKAAAKICLYKPFSFTLGVKQIIIIYCM